MTKKVFDMKVQVNNRLLRRRSAGMMLVIDEPLSFCPRCGGKRGWNRFGLRNFYAGYEVACEQCGTRFKYMPEEWIVEKAAFRQEKSEDD